MSQKKKSASKPTPNKAKKKSSKKRGSARKPTSAPLTAQNDTDHSVADAPFVLIVQVLAQGAATMDEVPIDGGTFVVGVLETLASTDAIGDLTGFEITIQHTPAGLELGASYVVHAQSWLYGDGLALMAIQIVPHTDDTTQAIVEQLQAGPQVAAMTRAAESELVASGRVVSIKEVKARASDPVTEHDPLWCEAVIEVESVEYAANNSKPKRVTVRFAASDDAQWADAPKVGVGDRRVFMLGDVVKATATANRAISGAKTNQYSLMHSGDALPIEALEDLRTMMQGVER